MRCFAAKHAGDRNQRVVLAGESKLFCGERQFECARNVDDLYIALLRPRPLERVQRGCEQPIGDETVETTDGDRKAQAARGELAVDFSRLELVGQIAQAPFPYFPLKAAARFSRKALVPSRMS